MSVVAARTSRLALGTSVAACVAWPLSYAWIAFEVADAPNPTWLPILTLVGEFAALGLGIIGLLLGLVAARRAPVGGSDRRRAGVAMLAGGLVVLLVIGLNAIFLSALNMPRTSGGPEPMIDAEIRELTPQPTAAVRMTQSMAELDLAALFDEHLPNVAHRLADIGIEPAGPPYGRYHEFGPEKVDVEIGIPVASPAPNLRPLADAEPGEMAASELPGGRAAITVHRGSYDGLKDTYDSLHDWIHAHGHDEGPGPWESYVDDPSEVDQAELKTEVCWPLA